MSVKSFNHTLMVQMYPGTEGVQICGIVNEEIPEEDIASIKIPNVV